MTDEEAAAIRRKALHDAYWAAHAIRFDMACDHTDQRPKPRGPDDFYNGAIKARDAIGALADPDLPVGISSHWYPENET